MRNAVEKLSVMELFRRRSCTPIKRERNSSHPFYGGLPFEENGILYCTCFECWKEFRNLKMEQMFEITCWKGLKSKFLEEFWNPSQRV